MNDELKTILASACEHAFCDKTVEIKSIEGVTQIRFFSMYSAPNITFDFLKAIGDHFGTTKVDVDEYSINEEGCKTCDWGSAYGHTLQIYGATRNIPEDGDTTWQ